MKSMVVLFALVAAACASWVPAQPAHHPALVLDPHGRPLDTAEVINARAIHLQAKALEHHAPLVHAAPLAYAAPAWGAHGLLGHSAYGLGYGYGHGVGHWLKKRSLAYAAPIVVAPAAVSHQSRVDVISKPAVVAHAIAPVVAHAVAAPVYAHALPAAVSHQSRIDIPASHGYYGHGLGYAAPYGHGLGYAAPYGHGLGYAAPYSYSHAHSAPYVHGW